MEEIKTKYRLSDWRSDMHDSVNIETDKGIMKRPSSTEGFYLSLLVIVMLCVDVSASSGLDAIPFLGCRPSLYILPLSKNITVRGQDLYCYDDIPVMSCRGRCDSYESGDFKIPYKISYHPVCMYDHITARDVKLRHCHPDHPQPTHKVFDASNCICAFCDSQYTSCENLNG